MNWRHRSRQLQNFITSNPLANKLIRLLREFRKRKSVISKIGGISRKSWNVKKAFRASIIILVIGVISLPFLKYLSLGVTPSHLAWDYLTPELVGKRTNIMLIVYRNGDRYSFIDALGLLSINANNNNYSVMMLNPAFSTKAITNNYISITNLLSNAVLEEQSPIGVTTSLLSGTFGLPVDRYVAIDLAHVPRLIEILGTDYRIPNSLEVANTTYLEGEMLYSSDVLEYLDADAVSSNEKMQRWADFVKSFFKQQSSWVNIGKILANIDEVLSIVETDLSKAELLSLIGSVVNMRQLTVNYTNTLDTFSIGGTKPVNVVNVTSLDSQIQALFVDPDVAKEQARIEVYNATPVSGLASKFRRYIKNYGGNVIRAGNFPDALEQTILYVPKPDPYLKNIELLKTLTRGKVQVVTDEYPYNHTAELVLVIGSDVSLL